jgi:hypothetical protein
MSEQKIHLKPDGHAHGWYDPHCWPISEGVCLRPTGRPVLLLSVGGDGPFAVFGWLEDGQLARVMIEFVGVDGDDGVAD